MEDADKLRMLRAELRIIIRTPEREMRSWNHKRIYQGFIDFIDGKTASPSID